MKTNDGKIIAVSGAARSGKSALTLRLIKQHKRLFVWDVEAQFCEVSGFKKVTTRKELYELATKNKGPLKVAFVSTGLDLKADFDYFCDCVYFAGRFVAPCAVVAEELSDVTTISKAPTSWGILIRRGLKRGIFIYAISQRWAEADKTTIGNASIFCVFQQKTGRDIEYMAKVTGAAFDDIQTLQKLEYLEIDTETKQIKRKKLTF